MNAPRPMPLPPQYPYKIDPDDPIFLSVHLYEKAYQEALAQLKEELRITTEQISSTLKQQTEEQIAQADRRVNAIINQGAEHLIVQVDERNQRLIHQLERKFQEPPSPTLSISFLPLHVLKRLWLPLICLAAAVGSFLLGIHFGQ